MPGVIERRAASGAYWERGLIIVPKSQWQPIRKFYRSKDAELRERLYGIALEIYDYLKQDSYRKHNYEFYRSCTDVLWTKYGYGHGTGAMIRRSMFPDDRVGAMLKPTRGKFIKKEVPDEYLFAGKAHLRLIDSGRVISWSYDADYSPVEGDSPHWYPEVRDILNKFKEIEYVRGTGGVLLTAKKSVGYGPLGQLMLGG